MNILKNDTIKVMAGKDKGRTGKVRRAIPKDDKLIIDGINMVKKHMRAQRGARQAGIVLQEAPIHISNVMLVCDKCNRPTRIGRVFLKDGEKARSCRRCGEVIA